MASSPKRTAHRHKQAPAWASRPSAAFQPADSEDTRRGHDEDLTRRASKWCRDIGATDLAGRVIVIWNTRLQTTAGTACPRNSTIELNPRLLQFGAAQVQRTLKHETAHLIAHWRHGRRRIQTHGVEWRTACADLGIPDEPAFHELPLPRRKVSRKYAYQCRHCGFTVKRVQPFQPYTACYRCCKRYTGGRYHANFLFQRIPFPLAPVKSQPGTTA